ncbi:DUF397 domain-containing protein [Actinomadura sp. GC306]|nr:DUF397 domain-containing protein [Actinomadura sp. GC306]
MAGRHRTRLEWRKSSRSSGEDDNSSCIEVASLDGHGVGARDSKDPDGPVLHFTTTEWAAFTHHIKHATVP